MSENTAATEAQTPYAELKTLLRESATLHSVGALIGWDQEVMMPEKAAAFRGEQMSLLSSLIHERRTSPRMGDLIAACEADAGLMADEGAAANLRNLRRDYDRSTKVPMALVREFAEVTTLGMHAWRDARERSDFAAFAPYLEKVVRLNRERAECYGIPEGGEAYDALLQDYEPGMSTAGLRSTFGALRAELTPLIREIAASGRQPDTSWQHTPLAVEKQVAFNRGVLERMGFDFGAGRLDVSTHPFCEGVGPGDVRLTTRYREDEFAGALNASMHETGHGLYEQGLPKAEMLGQPLAEAASMGIHESQSRFWENLIGRSRPFWEWALPKMKAGFSEPALERLDVDTVYRGMNVVQPNLIRIESDEATYNLHIMLRFDLERALLTGDLAVADLPATWNDRVKSDLGLDVPDDRRGCLQDIHWSMGAIGYFPTYTLGNLYAAQFWSTIRTALPELDDQVRRGEFGELLAWLRTNIHRHGRRYTAPELCQRVSGAPLSHEPLVRYLEAKLRPIYGI
ncbi:MAG TPA: carboxypeptidase M32 [Longimicrobiaceae bacterium]|jgi:carboxypeptidase Taq|nr:carboxypeptidase M32 [Longimicrobiaceae bacterium]